MEDDGIIGTVNIILKDIPEWEPIRNDLLFINTSLTNEHAKDWLKEVDKLFYKLHAGRYGRQDGRKGSLLMICATCLLFDKIYDKLKTYNLITQDPKLTSLLTQGDDIYITLKTGEKLQYEFRMSLVFNTNDPIDVNSLSDAFNKAHDLNVFYGLNSDYNELEIHDTIASALSDATRLMLEKE